MPAQTFISGYETFALVFKSSRTLADVNLSRFANAPILEMQSAGTQIDDIIFTTTKRRGVVSPPSTGLDDTQDELHCLKLTGGAQGDELLSLAPRASRSGAVRRRISSLPIRASRGSIA